MRLEPILIPSALMALALSSQAQTQGSFTAAQATEGQSGYAQNCAGCHGSSLDDGEFAPPLKGTAFTAQWGGKSVSDLYDYLRTKMPPSNAGGLGAGTYQQITAFVLQSNGVPLDAKNLPGGEPSDANGRPRAAANASPGGGLSPFASLIPAPPKSNPLDKLTPVTDALLQNPPAGDWLTWRRTYDDQGFSPLKQINRSNVGAVALGLELVAIPGRQRRHAAGPRRRHLRAQLWRSDAGSGCGDGRPAVAIFARLTEA